MSSVFSRRRWHAPALLFVLVWLSCVWFGSWAFNPNSATRILAATAIAETGSARIDDFGDMTIDKAQFDGHLYMDKAPGMTLMALPFVAATNWITDRTSFDIAHRLFDPGAEAFLRLRMRIAIAFTGAVLTALAALALLDLGTGMTRNRAAGLFAATGFAFGTIVWGWTTTFFGHAATTALFVIALWAVWKGSSGASPGRHTLIAGLALGWAVVVEHSAVLTGGPIALWALWRLRHWDRPAQLRTLGLAMGGGLIAAIPLFTYNIATFGDPFQTGYSGVVGFEGMKQGFFGLTYPKLDVLYELLIGKRRGIVWVSPVLALAPFGVWTLLRDPARRDIGAVAIVGAVLCFLYHAAYVYWDGGNATGPRHALPAIAYLAVGLAAYWGSANRIEKWLGLGFLVASIAINLMVASTEILAPFDFPAPLTQFILPRFLAGEIRTIPNEFWGWSPLAGMALYLGLAAILGVLFARAWGVRMSRG
ncbi:hypothetical protein FPZ54_17410 [Sphingomonas suaedae]|uniref:Glycosyltransferase RgtA/B/C/D-like domain-containing protein n=1 Tax=Sphingomonas suaedae TaxID=2599297 RepID=A0A518RJH6_9SPHN|nr:hypothetical protein [Sphingomonas suaedae]QDX27608.1 hypothetical protein FPZ54_17410 [Sphingomonas suaedae]